MNKENDHENPVPDDSSPAGARHMLLMAAGRLIAERGHAECVSVREIAAEAGVNLALVKYHFGDKAGLVRALLEYVVERHAEYRMSRYLEKNRALLDSADGCHAFVSGLVEYFCGYFRSGPDDRWWATLIYHLVHQSHDMYDYFAKYYYRPDADTFHEIRRLITGDDDPDRSYALFLSVFLPLAMRVGGIGNIDSLSPEKPLSENFNERYILFCKRQLLIGFGLLRTDQAI